MTLIRRERIAERPGSSAESEKIPAFESAQSKEEPAGRVFKEAPDFSYLKENAQKEARQLLNNAAAQAEEIKSTAREEGLREGRNEGLGQLQAHIKEALKLIDQANVERKKIIEQSSHDILNLSLQMAAKLTHSEINTRPEVLMNILQEAANKISDRDQVTIKVSSADFEFIKSKREEVEDLIDGVKKLNIVADKKVGPGGFIIETQMGYVDARLETKMSVIQEAFSQIEMEDRRALESSSEKYEEKSEPLADSETEEGEDMNRKKPYLDEDEQEKLDGGFEDEEEEKTEEDEAFEDEDLNLDDLDLDKMEE
jgi:flagellar assembly protein FliH